MTNFWPWLAVAGIGALHGLNPATGWALAAASGVRSHDRRQAWLALLPIAAGHVISVGLVAATVALGLSMDRMPLQLAAGGLLAVVAVHHLHRRRAAAARSRHRPLAIALWSFMVSTAHGAGLMLVPALVPLCLGDGPARALTASGSLGMALAAIGVHATAMLVVTGLMAAGTCRGLDRLAGMRQGPGPRPPAVHQAFIPTL